MRLAKVSASGLEGQTPSSARIRERTGCSVVAVERGEELFLEFDRGFEIRPSDSVYLCGSERAVSRYFANFPTARSPGLRGSI